MTWSVGLGTLITLSRVFDQFYVLEKYSFLLYCLKYVKLLPKFISKLHFSASINDNFKCLLKFASKLPTTNIITDNSSLTLHINYLYTLLQKIMQIHFTSQLWLGQQSPLNLLFKYPDLTLGNKI